MDNLKYLLSIAVHICPANTGRELGNAVRGALLISANKEDPVKNIISHDRPWPKLCLNLLGFGPSPL
jgi:hypothetical protein